jgi:hypothetical protein
MWHLYMQTLKLLARRFKTILASGYPKCRACGSANPYASPDQPDNSFFCSSCKALGVIDPALNDTIKTNRALTDAECIKIIIAGLHDVLGKNPGLDSAPRYDFLTWIWYNYRDMGGLNSKSYSRREQEWMEIDNAFNDYIQANPQIFPPAKPTYILKIDLPTFFDSVVK